MVTAQPQAARLGSVDSIGADALPPLTLLCRSLALLGAEGMSIGLAAWTVRIGAPLVGYVTSNQLPAEARRYVVLNMGCGAAAPVLLALALLAWKRARAIEPLNRLSLRAAPLALSFAVPLLFDWPLWKAHELAFLALATIFGLGLQRLARLSLLTPEVFPSLRLPQRLTDARAAIARSRALPLLFAILFASGYAFFFAFHTIRNHYRLGTAAMDLGLENNLVWNAAHLGPLFKSSPLGGPHSSHGGFHQTYFAYLLALPYRLLPKSETLLAIQAILMGAAAIPLYFLAKRRLGPWTACFIALLYTLYPPLHGANLYDFHYLPLGTVFLWTTLYLLEERRYFWAIPAVLVTLSIREDVSALLVIVGAFLLLTGERPIAGLVVSAVGAAYFVGVKLFLMPRFLGGSESFIHQYAGLVPDGERGYGGVLKTVFANPGFTIGTLLEKDKLVYLLQIMTPLAFFSWRRPIGFLCVVPGFFFTLLETGYPPLVQTSFQYTAYWTTFLFVAVVANLDWLNAMQFRNRERATEFRASKIAWLLALGASMLVTTNQFGAFIQQNTIRGGFGQYRFNLLQSDVERHNRLYRLIAEVPPDAKIVSSETIVPHVSYRPNSYTLRTGIYDADYLLVWMPPRGDEFRPAADALRSGEFGVVDVAGEFVLAKKGAPTDRNAEVLSRFHL